MSIDTSKYRKLDESENPEIDTSKYRPLKRDTVLEAAQRTANQVPQGLLEATPPFALASVAEASAAERTREKFRRAQELKEQFPDLFPRAASINFESPESQEQISQGIAQSSQYVPTVSNLAGHVERATGLPLSPKEWYQRAVRQFTSTAAMRGGELPERLIAGGTAPAVTLGLEAAGFPEDISELTGTAIGLIVPSPQKAFKLPPMQRVQTLQERFVPKELEKGTYETAEAARQALSEAEVARETRLRQEHAAEQTAREQAQIAEHEATQAPKNRAQQLTKAATEALPPRATTEQEILAGRVSPQGRDIGLRPAATPKNPTLPEAIGAKLSPDVFFNETTAGQTLKNEIGANDKALYKTEVNPAYDRVRELNSGIDEIHPEFVNELVRMNGELSGHELSAPQKKLQKTINTLLRQTVVFNKDGGISGYKPYPSQKLIDQIQAIRHSLSYDFAHGNPEGIYQPLLSALDSAIEAGAMHSGRPEAYTSLKAANAMYRDWAQTFNNDYVRPYRDTTNHDYTKLYNDALKSDNFNVIRRALERSPEGTKVADAAKRALVEKRLGPFLEDIRSADPEAVGKQLRELQAVITPDQAAEILRTMNEYRQPPKGRELRGRAEEIGKPEEAKLGKTERFEAPKRKYEIRTEDLLKRMDTRTGIREVRADLEAIPNGEKLFNQLRQKKTRSIMRQGKVEVNATGKEIYEALNQEAIHEVMSEMWGEEVVDAARAEAKDIGKSEARREIGKRSAQAVGKTAAKLTGAWHILRTMIGVAGGGA